jgi:hypothetical protein
LLVEIKIAIQRDSYQSIHAQVYYNLNWIHLYQTSSLLPGHLPIVTSVILRLLY